MQAERNCFFFSPTTSGYKEVLNVKKLSLCFSILRLFFNPSSSFKKFRSLITCHCLQPTYLLFDHHFCHPLWVHQYPYKWSFQNTALLGSSFFHHPVTSLLGWVSLHQEQHCPSACAHTPLSDRHLWSFQFTDSSLPTPPAAHPLSEYHSTTTW